MKINIATTTDIEDLKKLIQTLLEEIKKKDALEEERFVSIEETAKFFSVSPSSIKNWAREGRIRKYYLGGSVRFKLSELLEYAESSL